jgi:hypothetical protein
MSLVANDGIQSSPASTVQVVAGTLLSGIIAGDTALSQLESPYVMTAELQIPFGFRLTAGENVEIHGNGNTILVGGSLEFAGTETNRVSILNAHISPATGPVAEHFNISLTFVHLIGGSLYAPTGNAIYGGLNIYNSIIEDVSDYIYLWYPVSTSSIERNVFVRSGGISTGTRDADVAVRNNVFVEQTTDFAIENWATYSSSVTLVELNSFLSTDRVALSLPPGYSDTMLDGANNFWNTTDMVVVDSMISDKNDDIEIFATINFDPILLAPDPSTPSYP